MADKMTNRKALGYVLDHVADLPADVKEKLTAMAVALDNKSASTTRKPTAKQTENIGFREKIMEFLRSEPNRLLTCTEIGKEIAELNGMNNQRVSALMRPLVESGQVVKTSAKGKTLFQLAKESDTEGEAGIIPRFPENFS